VASPASDAAPADELIVNLDAPLPESLAVGGGTALFVAGACFCPSQRIRSLELVVDGRAEPAMAYGMPRLDLFRTLHPGLDPFDTAGVAADPDSPDDPLLHAYCSGFWALARLLPGAQGEREIHLRAHLENGGHVDTEVARIAEERARPPEAIDAPAPGTGPLVAVCMATYDPLEELFERQIESIRGQTHANWVCVISDDCSQPERFQATERAVAGDPRFVISRSPRRLGFYRNFERALAMAPAEAAYVAMADQDDAWHPDKLEALLSSIGDAQLAYSDARIVGPDGRVMSDTYWPRRRNNHGDMASLLMANCVTGAASLARRETLEHALPFPPAQFTHFHDHWMALTALALGDIAFVDRPLYDYVQHGDAVLGHAAANRMTGLGPRLGRLFEDPRERVVRWRMTFFVDNCRLLALAAVLQLRCGQRMARPKRRALERFAAADRSAIGPAWLALRAAREFAGRPETLGAELGLLFGFAWRRLLAATARRRERPARRLRMDAVPPPSLAPRPGRPEPAGPAARAVAEKIAPLAFAAQDDADARINLLIPTIDLEHFFGGYIAKFNLARRLSERGLRVRIVTVDPVGSLPRSWKRTIESYEGLSGLFERVEVAFGRESDQIELSRSDAFIATTWWTAHIAHAALRSVEAEQFLYLIQEYEPFTFPMGSHAALAAESYRLPHAALFSTELLRGYFRRHAIGVYAGGEKAGDEASTSFQNAITAVHPPTAAELGGREARRLLFYARPEPHAARNLFELGVLGLGEALRQGVLDGWELHGIGTTAPGRRIALGGGVALELLPRATQGSYADALRRHDVGLALMYTPHPSLVPIEMASAGMLAVTNSFENKTPEVMAEISSNLVTVEPTVAGVVAGLRTAVERSADPERRASGSHVSWSRDWDRSFDPGVLDRVASFLGSR